MTAIEAVSLDTPPLRVDSAVKCFGKTTALAGVTLDVKQGECLGLLGPNGAGKSTLIRGIAGRILLDSGTIQVFGGAANSAEARAALGWVPQDLAIYPLLTCRENLETFGRYYGLRGSQLKSALEWALEWAGLTDRSRSVVGTLSGGMKRRLNLVASLLHKPRMVLLDEPTVGIDPQSRNRIFEMVTELRQQGATILYTTHYMEEAERLCDSIAIVDGGRILTQGTSKELIHAAFGGGSDVVLGFLSEPPTVGNSKESCFEQLVSWVGSLGGTVVGSTAHFPVQRSSEVGSLLEAAARMGLEVKDLTLHQPNLESVFLKLTGRDLRP